MKRTLDIYFKALPLYADFSNTEEVVSMIDKIITRYGRLDVLINNAGMYKRTVALIPQTLNLYHGVMQVNTNATVNLTSKAIEHLMKAKGTIVFISSVGSFKPEPYGYAYCMSKAAISMYAKCLAQELAPTVRVNVVCPGVTKTNIFSKAGIEMDSMIDYFNATNLLGRVATPEEIAKSVFFLASDDSSYTTGECLVVDGGYCMNSTNIRDTIRSSRKE